MAAKNEELEKLKWQLEELRQGKISAEQARLRAEQARETAEQASETAETAQIQNEYTLNRIKGERQEALSANARLQQQLSMRTGENINDISQLVRSEVNQQVRDQHVHACVEKVKHNDYINPKKFIQELERYLVERRIYPQDYLIETQNILTDNTKKWHLNSENSFNNFDNFKREYLNKFYSDFQRSKFKNQWLDKKHKSEWSYDV